MPVYPGAPKVHETTRGLVRAGDLGTGEKKPNAPPDEGRSPSSPTVAGGRCVSGNATVTACAHSGGMTQSAERAALLVLRVWIEEDTSTGFRARILAIADLQEPHETTAAASSPAQVLAMVRDWLAHVRNVSPEELTWRHRPPDA